MSPHPQSKVLTVVVVDVVRGLVTRVVFALMGITERKEVNSPSGMYRNKFFENKKKGKRTCLREVKG